MATLDIIYEETKKISDLQVQLLNYFRHSLSDNFDGGNTTNSVVNDPIQNIPAVDSTNIVNTLANAMSTSS